MYTKAVRGMLREQSVMLGQVWSVGRVFFYCSRSTPLNRLNCCSAWNSLITFIIDIISLSYPNHLPAMGVNKINDLNCLWSFVKSIANLSVSPSDVKSSFILSVQDSLSFIHSFIHSFIQVFIQHLFKETTQRCSQLQHGQKEQFSIDYRMCLKVSLVGGVAQEGGHSMLSGPQQNKRGSA